MRPHDDHDHDGRRPGLDHRGLRAGADDHGDRAPDHATAPTAHGAAAHGAAAHRATAHRDAPPTTVVDPAATTTTVVDPAATTTTVLVDPAATTTTTVVDPAATTTTVVAAAEPAIAAAPLVESTTTTTVVEPEPLPPPPSGPVVMPQGRIDTGEIRSVTFPVAGPVRYANDWGACRDGCARSHQGNDVIGDRLQPILAMADGVVDHFIDDHPTAGYGVAIIDADGWQYHVYHMNNDTPGTDDGVDDGTWRYLPGLVLGSEVHAGQVIGWMGDSGNSEGSVPHAHVEIHRPDGSPINPFWSLRLAQRDVNCASSALAATRDISGPDWLTEGWLAAPIDPAWRPLELHGGDHGADLGDVDARMWIGPTGFHPVDGAAVLVGDPAYDEDVDCAALADEALDIEASIPTELATILATIRTLESGHDYSAQSRSSTASGAYQFIDSSWNGFGGYARAKDAPPAVQDAAAALHALSVLARTGGDVSMVPVYWYIGHAPTAEEWDIVPPVGANVLTPRAYQARWLDVYGQLVGRQFVPASAPRVGADHDLRRLPDPPAGAGPGRRARPDRARRGPGVRADPATAGPPRRPAADNHRGARPGRRGRVPVRAVAARPSCAGPHAARYRRRRLTSTARTRAARTLGADR